MNFPLQIDSPEDELAKAIANDLVIDGINGMLALPLAIKLMAIIDEAHTDPLIGVKKIKEQRKQSDQWWVDNWPKTKNARQAKKRLNAKL
jgi:hypothetical protein